MVLIQLDAGILAEGYRKLLRRVMRLLPGNTRVFDLWNRVAAAPSASGPPRSVLLLSASPLADALGAPLGRLQPEVEYRAILDAAGSRLNVDYRPFATFTDVRRLLEIGHDVLHLACHGNGDLLTFHDAAAGAGPGRPPQAIHAADLAAVLLAYQGSAGPGAAARHRPQCLLQPPGGGDTAQMRHDRRGAPRRPARRGRAGGSRGPLQVAADLRVDGRGRLPRQGRASAAGHRTRTGRRRRPRDPHRLTAPPGAHHRQGHLPTSSP
nr:hypothetical protein GCM10020092_089860 [Actinoplanes digitatis]